MDKIKRLWSYLFVNPGKKKSSSHSGKCCKSVENEAKKPLYGATTTSDAATITASTASNTNYSVNFKPSCSADGGCCCCCKNGPNTGKEWVSRDKGNS